MKKINRFLLLSLIFTALIFISGGCKKQTSGDLSGSYTIEIDKSIAVPSGSTKTSLTALEFIDGRCPAGKTCANAGAATVKIRYKDSGSEQIVKLCFGDDCSPESAKMIVSNRVFYTVKLINAGPNPGVIPFMYVPRSVTIEISKAN
jgi:hypothetical protein